MRAHDDDLYDIDRLAGSVRALYGIEPEGTEWTETVVRRLEASGWEYTVGYPMYGGTAEVRLMRADRPETVVRTSAATEGVALALAACAVMGHTPRSFER